MIIWYTGLMTEEKIMTLHPEGKQGVNISKAKYDQIKGASPDALPDLATEFFEKSSENLWFIGTVGNLPHVGVLKNNFHNVPEAAISDWLQLTPGNTAPEQYFKS